MKKIILGLVLSSSVILVSNAQADQSYIRASIGQSTFSSELVPISVDDFLVELDEAKGNDTYLSVALGMEINKNFSLEIAYNNFGEVEDDVFYIQIPGDSLTIDLEAVLSSFSVAVLGKMPINERVSIFAKLGLEKWSGDYKVTITDTTADAPISIKGDDDDTDFFYGVGLSIQIDSSVSLVAQYDIHNFDASELDLDTELAVFSVGGQLKF